VGNDPPAVRTSADHQFVIDLVFSRLKWAKCTAYKFLERKASWAGAVVRDTQSPLAVQRQLSPSGAGQFTPACNSIHIPSRWIGRSREGNGPLPETGLVCLPHTSTSSNYNIFGEGKIGDGLSNSTPTLFLCKPTRCLLGGNRHSKVNRIQYFGDRAIEIMCKDP